MKAEFKMKAIKFTMVGLLLSGFAIAQSTDAKQELLKVPQPEPVFKSGEFGIRYMPAYSSMEFRSSGGTKHKGKFVIGHGVGAFLAINSRHVGLQLEVIYNSLWQKYKDDTNHDREIQLKYITIPLLLTLNTDKSKPVNLHVAVGPQLGINVGSKVETSGTNGNGNGTDTLQAVLAVKKSDFGIAYGAGIEFALNPARSIRLGLGFQIGRAHV